MLNTEQFINVIDLLGHQTNYKQIRDKTIPSFECNNLLLYAKVQGLKHCLLNLKAQWHYRAKIVRLFRSLKCPHNLKSQLISSEFSKESSFVKNWLSD